MLFYFRVILLLLVTINCFAQQPEYKTNSLKEYTKSEGISFWLWDNAQWEKKMFADTNQLRLSIGLRLKNLSSHPTAVTGEPMIYPYNSRVRVMYPGGSSVDLDSTGGDMYKSVYDANNNGVVDSALGAARVAWNNVYDKPPVIGDMLTEVYDGNGNDIVDAAESVPWSGITNNPDSVRESKISDSTKAVAWNSVSGEPAGIASIGDMTFANWRIPWQEEGTGWNYASLGAAGTFLSSTGLEGIIEFDSVDYNELKNKPSTIAFTKGNVVGTTDQIDTAWSNSDGRVTLSLATNPVLHGTVEIDTMFFNNIGSWNTLYTDSEQKIRGLTLGSAGTYYRSSGSGIPTFANTSTMRTDLGLVIGTNVQAYDADLDDLADGTLTGSKVSNALADGATKGVASFVANDFDATSGNIGIDYTNGQAANGSTKGFLTSADWTTFNNKQAAGSYLTAADSINKARIAYRDSSGQSIANQTWANDTFQPKDADLTTYAGITPSANIQTFLGSANYAAANSNLGLGTEDSPNFTAMTVGTGTAGLTVSASGLTSEDADLTGRNITLTPGSTDVAGVMGYTILVGGWKSDDPGSVYQTTFKHNTALIANRQIDIPNAAGTMAVSASGYLSLSAGGDITLSDGELTSIGGLTSAADRLPYYTGSGTAALATFTSQARNLLDDATAGAMATTIGVGTGDSPTMTGLTLTGLTAGRVLIAGSGDAIADDALLLYNQTTDVFSVTASSYPTMASFLGSGANTYGVHMTGYYPSVTFNAIHNGSIWSTYKTGFAAVMVQDPSTGLVNWGNVSASVTAGNTLTWQYPFALDKDANVGLGGVAAGIDPTLARLEISQPTIQSLSTHLGTIAYYSTATNDDPTVIIYQGRVATTDATVTDIFSQAVASGKAYVALVRVVGRRTGGSSGASGDYGIYERTVAFRNESNTVTVNGSSSAVDVTTIYENQAGWAVDVIQSTTNVKVRVTGAANNNITWHLVKFEVSYLGS